MQLEFRSEFYNIFNHPQLGQPQSAFNPSNTTEFGSIINTVNYTPSYRRSPPWAREHRAKSSSRCGWIFKIDSAVEGSVVLLFPAFCLCLKRKAHSVISPIEQAGSIVPRSHFLLFNRALFCPRLIDPWGM